MREVYFKYKKYLIGGLICSILFATLQVGWAFAFQIVVDSVVNLDLNASIQALGILTAMSVFVALFSYGKNFFLFKYLQRTLAFLNNILFRNFISKDYVTFFEKSEGDYLNTVVKLSSELREQYIIPLFRIVGSLVTSLLAFIAVVYYHYIMAIVVLVLFGLQLLIPILKKKLIAKSTSDYTDESGVFSGKTQNLLGGFELILSKNIRDKAEMIFDNSSEMYQKKFFRMRNIRHISEALVYLAQFLIILVPWFVGAVLVVNGELTFGMLMAVSQLNNSVSGPFSQVIASYNEYLGGREIARKIEADVLSENRLGQAPFPLKDKFSSLTTINLCFSYGNKPVLKDINLTFESHKKYVIIGESGCGKSTLAKILGGLLTSYDGSITINDLPVNAEAQSIFNISNYSPQETYLLNDTLKNNIALYSDVTDSEIKNALKKVELQDFSYALPDGVNTLLGSGGNLVSGGQKQRIGIARALIGDAQIIIFDEPTASLDSKLHSKVEELILSFKDVTLISINHRLSEDALKRYDTIIFMQGGKVAGMGNYDDLIIENEDFALFVK